MTVLVPPAPPVGHGTHCDGPAVGVVVFGGERLVAVVTHRVSCSGKDGMEVVGMRGWKMGWRESGNRRGKIGGKMEGRV